MKETYLTANLFYLGDVVGSSIKEKRGGCSLRKGDRGKRSQVGLIILSGFAANLLSQEMGGLR